MTKVNDPKEILKFIKMLSPQTLPRLEYISREDLTLTNVREGGIKEGTTLTTDMRYPQPAAYPLGAENAHGEIEVLGNSETTVRSNPLVCRSGRDHLALCDRW